MKKIILLTLFVNFALVSFGQYSSSNSENETIIAIAGVIGLITTVVIWVIAARLKKLNEQQKLLIRIQTKSAISMGAIKGRTCVRCGDTHAPELIKDPDSCPNCEILYKRSRVILKHNNVIDSYSREFYERNKNESELLWEYKK